MKHAVDSTRTSGVRAAVICCLAYITLLHPQATLAAVEFTDRAWAAGVAAPGESYGASWGDLNGDGYPDLFLSNHRKQPTVYVNKRDGTFQDTRDQVFPWVNRSGADTHGGTWSDFDSDGDEDLLITTGTGNDQQMLVNERGEMIDRTLDLGIDVENVGGRMAMWLDYDRDGRMDFVDIQFGGIAQLFRQTSWGSFVNKTGGSNMLCNRIQYGHLLDVNGDDRLDIVCAHDAEFPRKIYSTTRYPFVDITWQFPTVETVSDSIVADFDNNGEMDVFFVSGVQLRPSGASQASPRKVEALLQNGSKGLNFVSAGRVAVELDWNKLDWVKDSNTRPLQRIVVGSNRKNLVSGTSFTLDPNDWEVRGIPPSDPSSAPELRIGYDTSVSPARWVFIIDSVDEQGKQVFSEAYLQITANQKDITGLRTSGMWGGDNGGVPTLMMNHGGGFHDATKGSGLQQKMSCVSATAGDFDNDMDVDLYLACRTGASNIVNRYYDNDGYGNFTLVPGAGGARGPIGTNVADGAGTADSVVTADYDNDGFLDLFVTNGFNLRPKDFGGPNNLYRNRGNSNRWLQLDLVGTRGTRDPVGARVEVTAYGVTQTRVVDGGYHRWSQNHDRLHFGLGSAGKADVKIHWPDGSIQNHRDVATNRFYTATEGGGIAVTRPGRGVPFACGEPSLNGKVDRGVFVWKECYLNLWRVRFAAGGDTRTFKGQVASDVAIDTVNQVGGGSRLDLSNPKTLVFEVTEAWGSLKGFNLIPGAGSTRHCLTLQTPSGTPIYYGPLKERVSTQDLRFELGESCSGGGSDPVVDDPVVGTEAVCGDPGLDPSTEAGIGVWKNCPGDQWQVQAVAGGLGWTSYRGTVESSSGFASWQGDSVESTDTLELSSWTRLTFDLGLLPPWYDGLKFTPNAGGETCFTLDEPGGADIVVGSDRTRPSGSSFSLVELGQPCSGGGGEPVVDDPVVTDDTACGDPGLDPSTEAGVAIWRNCPGDQWQMQVVAGGLGWTSYSGTVESSTGFASWQGDSLESNDTLVRSPWTLLTFDMGLAPPWYDGMKFTPNGGSETCFTLDAPAGADIVIGADRTRPSGNSFSLTTLGSCAP